MSVSFRDPDGFVQDDGQRIQRFIRPESAAATKDFLGSALYQSLVAAGQLIPAQDLQTKADGSLQLSHPRVPLPSYAFEWTPAMLADAALLTLDIQAAAWAAGWTLKDAAASNVLFDNCRAVFCDLLSFRRREEADQAGWVAYGQFVRNFVLPLLAVGKFGRTPRDVFLASRDGLRASEVAPFLPWHSHLGLSMLLHVSLPAWFERRRITSRANAAKPGSGTASRPGRHDASDWLLGDLRKFVQRLRQQRGATTSWSHYTENREHYGNSELGSKCAAVKAVLDGGHFSRVLDIGANSGEFSRLAVAAGCSVVALDNDLSALDELHQRAAQEGLPIQCLHANFARPTPATGWRNGETMGLAQRLRGQFDLVLMLAVIHHLAVSERLPLAQVFEEVAGHCSHSLLIEFVPLSDPRFIEIAGPNIELYKHWSLDGFIAAALPWFRLVRSLPIAGGSERQLLLLEKTA
nr:class I SAM-dependent methyltransferase [uncultured Roseateles sp.]